MAESNQAAQNNPAADNSAGAGANATGATATTGVNIGGFSPVDIAESHQSAERTRHADWRDLRVGAIIITISAMGVRYYIGGFNRLWLFDFADRYAGY